MISFDKRYVSTPLEHVSCHLRGREVDVATCLECPELIGVQLDREPRYVLCQGYETAGWLGLDET